MLTYHAALWTEEGVVLAKVIDFPGVIAYGNSIEEARLGLSHALVDMAETALLRGEALPVPDPAAVDEAAELNEPVHLVLSAGTKVSVQVSAGLKRRDLLLALFPSRTSPFARNPIQGIARRVHLCLRRELSIAPCAASRRRG